MRHSSEAKQLTRLTLVATLLIAISACGKKLPSSPPAEPATTDATQVESQPTGHLVRSATPSDFDRLIANPDMPVLVDFWAPWCGPCLQMSPIVEELSSELEGQAVVIKVNVDDLGDVAKQYSIRSIPTFMVFRQGQVIDQIVGTCTKEELIQSLRSAM